MAGNAGSHCQGVNTNMKLRLSVLILLFYATTCFSQQHHDQKPEDPFTLKKLTDRVYALYGRGGNVGFYVGSNAVFVVDSQYLDLAPGIIAKIKTVTDKPIKYLLNTHHHPDHVGGNKTFLEFALILAHDNVRKRVLASPKEILAQYPKYLEEAKQKGDNDRVKWFQEQIDWAKTVKIEEIPAPFLTFDSEFRIHLDETIQVWHTPPAHTDGDGVAYFEKSNVLHMGDLFFNKVIPFIDVEGGGSATGYVKAIDLILSRVPSNVVIIPGHGEVTDVAGLKEFRAYIQQILDLAKAAKAAGKSKEQFVKETDLPAIKAWRGYDDRFKENLEAAYDDAR
jgi:cyclase